MRFTAKIKRFLQRNDGFMISTETIVWVTLTVCVLVVGITALRIVVRSLFLDAAESLASRESGFVFMELGPNANAPFLTTRISNSSPPGTFPAIGPLLPSRPTPTPASKEGS